MVEVALALWFGATGPGAGDRPLAVITRDPVSPAAAAVDGGAAAPSAGLPLTPAPSGEVPPVAPPVASGEVVDPNAESPLPPEITADGLHDELRRAARERRALSAKVSEERAKLTAERTQLGLMAKQVEAARESLRQETRRLQAQLDHRPSGEGNAPPAPAAKAAPAGPQPIDAVSKTLKGMKPDQAAQVLLHLEPSLAVALLDRLKPADAGAVLEKLKAEEAAKLVAGLAARRLRESGHE